MLHHVKILQDNPSTNFKLSYLEQHKNDDELKQFFYLALNPKIRFWIKQLPIVESSETPSISLPDAFRMLSTLSDRIKTGNDARNYLHELLSNLSSDDQEVIRRIIKKDPNCGVSHTTVNKVWKKLIPVHPYMGAKSCTEKNLQGIDFDKGVFIQTKCDGLYADIINNGDDITWLTRSGNEFIQMNEALNDELIDMFKSSFVLNGEFRISDGKGGYLDRKTGNGILNSIQQGTATSEEIELVRYTVWDLITPEEHYNEKSNVPYEERLNTLFSFIGSSKYINIVETETIYSLKEALDFYKKRLQEGEEGAVLKNKSTLWKPGKHKDQVKLKIQEPVDLVIVGVTKHRKKKGWIGSLICESSCGKLSVNVGSGLKDKHRKLDPSEYIGKIVEVYSNGVIDSENKDTKSLYLPTLGKNFDGVRTDKITADSLDEIIEKFENILK